MKNNKVLVTGGAGFIGSNYVAYVLGKSQDEIFVLDNLTYAGDLRNLKSVSHLSNYHFVKGDICDETFVQELFAIEEFWFFFFNMYVFYILYYV